MLTDRPFTGSSLCVVGNVNRDVKTASFPAVDSLFHDGETSISSITETIGGGGANSAFAAATLGGNVSFAGKVGADALGDRLHRAFTKHGIAAHLARSADHPSGTSIALNFDNGHRHFLSCLPANEALCFADLDMSALAGRDHLLRADIWFSETMLFEGNLALFQKARQLAIAVSIDLNWDPKWGVASAETIRARKQAVRATLPFVDLAHGNIRELREFTDADTLEIALKRLAEWGAGAVVVHMGERGAGYFCDGSLIVEPPAPVSARLNSTGTGDVLSVCMMLLHRRNELDIPARLRRANGIVAQFMEGKRRLIPALEG